MKQIETKSSLLALSPLAVFLCMYLLTSIILQDFYKIPITVAFLTSAVFAIAITRHKTLDERIKLFSAGAGNQTMMLMMWIFILAGAFAGAAKSMGAIDATVNFTLRIMPDNMLLPGLFLASCFISLAIGTSVGTTVALTPVAAGIAAETGIRHNDNSHADARLQDARQVQGQLQNRYAGCHHRNDCVHRAWPRHPFSAADSRR